MVDTRHIGRRIAFFAAVAIVAVLAVLTLPGIGDVRERLGSAEPWWLAVAATFSLVSMLGFVRALWAVFDRIVPWRRCSSWAA